MIYYHDREDFSSMCVCVCAVVWFFTIFFTYTTVYIYVSGVVWSGNEKYFNGWETGI